MRPEIERPSGQIREPPHPEERSAAKRLEGWQRAPCLLPCFETLASLAPQDGAELWRH